MASWASRAPVRGRSALRRRHSRLGHHARPAPEHPQHGRPPGPQQAAQVRPVRGVAHPQLEGGGGIGQAAKGQQGPAHVQGGPGALLRRRQPLDRVRQPAEGVGGAAMASARPSSSRTCARSSPEQRLLAGALEQLHRARRVALRQGARRGAAEHGDHPIPASAACVEQVARHGLGVRVLLREHARGPQVRPPPARPPGATSAPRPGWPGART